MKRRWFIIQAAELFAADQLIKTCVEQKLEKGEEKKLAGPAVLRRVSNKGMCFGFLSGEPGIVRGLSLAASAAVTVCGAAALVRGKSFLKKEGYCLAAAGAWSNTFDRFVRGYVVDYIGFRLKHSALARLTYNLGDFLIAAGALFISFHSLEEQFSLRQSFRQK